MKTIIKLLACFVFFTLIHIVPASAEQKINARSIIVEVEKTLWGNTSQGHYKMKIITPYWQRTLKMKVWMQRPDKSFIRIISPAKEAGVGSLRIKNEMWNYLPKVERIVKVPPSMMLQAWMGSDFTNDDLVKESSMIDDYTHRVIAEELVDGKPAYRIESIPKPNAPVVWGKLIYLVRKNDLMPLKFDYYDERGRLIKTLTFSKVRNMDDRLIPTTWKMRSTNKPGNFTVIELEDIIFDMPINDRVFTLRNLRGR